MLANFIYVNQFSNAYPASMNDLSPDVDNNSTLDHRFPTNLLVLQPEELALFTNTVPVYVDLSFSGAGYVGRGYKNIIDPKESWTYKSDKPGKAKGLISEAVGSTYLLEVPKSDIVTFTTLHISLLQSYEGMGQLQVRVYSGNTTHGQATIDCQWMDHTSRAMTIPLPLSLSNGMSKLTSNPFVHLQVVDSDPVRLENKVKLFYLIIM